MIDWTIRVEFANEDGVARATLSLDSQKHGQYVRQMEITASGDIHSATGNGYPRMIDYTTAEKAMEAVIKRASSDIVHAWGKYAAEHGPGVR